ncbi:hypothetical protein N7452_000911 [Penicillium brevicompactum]|uniref:Zn(2)-C6 fungal-type domain-containing protein n=1 Tax=Penicillium brevicompactum TaxID=5074 RepID=A0A9W9R1C4_PENBR|nr:hypothetical protein N7452_000911 [Penicillium brevicompactum]
MNPCWTCRNRRVQCDLSGSPCAKCTKAGVECFDKRPLRWVKGVAIRGRMQGYSYEGNQNDSSKASKNAKRPRSKQDVPASALVKSFDGTRRLPTALPDPSMLNLDQVSKYYIDYYNERICKLFIVYDSDRNPFRSLISFGLQDPVLQKAILALAARHHANTGQSFSQIEAPTSPGLVNADRDALSFKHQAMEALSRTIGAGDTQKNDTTVASIFLLIFLDLLESGGDGWNFHLKGAKSLITSYRPMLESQAGVNDGPGQTLQEIWGFIANQIHSIETLGATFLRPKTLTDFTSVNNENLQPQEAIEKSFLGCPEYLLTAIQFFSNERDTIAESDLSEEATRETHIQDTTAMLELVQNFDSYAWALSVQHPRQPSVDEISNLCTLSQAFKTGTLLYGGRVLDALKGTYTVQDELVSELLGVCCGRYLLLGWSVNLNPSETFWVECLEVFWKDTSCLNVVNAAKILRNYWEKLGSDNPSKWIFDIGCLGRDWLLL